MVLVLKSLSQKKIDLKSQYVKRMYNIKCKPDFSPTETTLNFLDTTTLFTRDAYQ